MALNKGGLERLALGELFPYKPSKAQRTQLAIIESAIKCYATLGIEKSTAERIAKTCGISRPLVQHYFPDREGLLEMSIKYIRTYLQKLAVDAVNSRPD